MVPFHLVCGELYVNAIINTRFDMSGRGKGCYKECLQGAVLRRFCRATRHEPDTRQMYAGIRTYIAILNWTPTQALCQLATHASEPKMGLCYDVLSREHMATEAYKQAWKTLLECRDMDLSRNAGAHSTPECPLVDEKKPDAKARVNASAAQLLDDIGTYAQYFRVVRKHMKARRKRHPTEMILSVAGRYYGF